MTDRTRTESRPAVAADFQAFYGRGPEHTVRARTLERNGKVLGIAGYYLVDGVAIMFSDANPGIPKSLIWREAVAFMAELTVPVYCGATDRSRRFLERLGWQRTEEGVYLWRV